MSSERPARNWVAAFVTTIAALAAAFAVACKDRQDPVEPQPEPPALAISHAANRSGSLDFFFLPPLGSDPREHPEYDPDGFDATLSPEVQICIVTEDACGEPQGDFPLLFSMTSGPGSETVRLNDEIEADEEDEHYIVNWHTSDFDLAEVTYRIRVLVAGTELGFADVDLVGSDEEIEKVEINESIVLKLGRTLPIKFRIEEGAVYVIGHDGGTVSAIDGKVTIEFPEGATDKDIGVTVQEVTGFPEPERVPGGVYDLGPDGEDFKVPVRVTIQYDEPDNIDERTLRLHKAAGGEWQLIPGSTVNTDENTVTGYVSDFTPYTAAEATAASIVTTPAGAALSGIGSQQTLTAETYAEDGNLIIGKVLNWASLNTDIVTVDASSGVVTAVGAGQAAVQAEVDGAVGYALVTVATPGISPVNLWADEESGTTEDLTAVWGTSPSSVFAVGENGTIVRRDATGWSSMTSNTSERLNHVWGTSASDVYAVGANGTVLHYDGATWSIVADVGVTGNLTAVWGTSPVDVYVLEGAGVYHFDGTTWSMFHELEGQLTDIWGTSPTDFHVVGHTPEEGFVYHYDGTDWIKQASFNWGYIYKIWGSSPNNIIGAGWDGVVHSDGASWTWTQVHGQLVGVSGTSPVDAYATGRWGQLHEIRRYDGAEWVYTGRHIWRGRSPLSMWATSGDVFGVGIAGTIVRGLRDATVTVAPSHHTFGRYLDDVDLSAEVRDAAGNIVYAPCLRYCDVWWASQSSDESVAQVEAFNVKAAGWGTATITITAPGGATGSATVELPGTQYVFDGTGIGLGPLPGHMYVLADAGTGSDIYPVGAGELYMFSLFDTGSEIVLINEIEAPVLGIGSSSPDNPYQDTRVRISGLAAINPTTRVGPIYEYGATDGAQAEVLNIRVGPRTGIDYSLIGAPVANEVLALIDNTTFVTRGPYDYCNCFQEAPDITFFMPGDGAAPIPDLQLQLERFDSTLPSESDGATKGQRYFLRNVAFVHGPNAVTDDQTVMVPFNFFYDTGATPTIINVRMANALGLDLQAGGIWDCWDGGGMEGYVLDHITMIGTNSGSEGGYKIDSAWVCVDIDDVEIHTYFPDPSDPTISTKVDAVIGSNLFMYVPILFDGPGNTLGIIGTP